MVRRLFRDSVAAICAVFLFPWPGFAPPAPMGYLADPIRLAQDGAKRNNFLPVWVEFQTRRDEYLASAELRAKFTSIAGWVGSYLGEYRSAFAIAAPERRPQAAEDDPDLRRELDKYHLADALATIAEMVRDRRVVMINEDHRDPSHRAFTTELLPILRKEGFRYLAAEAFPSHFDLADYPQRRSGFMDDPSFTNDPVFGDMVRRARELGFILVSYEADTNCGHEPQEPGARGLAEFGSCMERREEGQARNLARFLDAHPEAKLLVHAGLAHIQKMKVDFGPMMAWKFREFTKIDPLSIDQSYLTGHGSRFAFATGGDENEDSRLAPR